VGTARHVFLSNHSFASLVCIRSRPYTSVHPDPRQNKTIKAMVFRGINHRLGSGPPLAMEMLWLTLLILLGGLDLLDAMPTLHHAQDTTSNMANVHGGHDLPDQQVSWSGRLFVDALGATQFFPSLCERVRLVGFHIPCPQQCFQREPSPYGLLQTLCL
jgi:hypothetical protein